MKTTRSRRRTDGPVAGSSLTEHRFENEDGFVDGGSGRRRGSPLLDDGSLPIESGDVRPGIENGKLMNLQRASKLVLKLPVDADGVR